MKLWILITNQFCTSSLPLNLFMTQDMPALTPVMTAKLRACANGPPPRACEKNPK